MLPLDEIQDELHHIIYRPGWTMTAYPHPCEGAWLTICADMPNAYDPEDTTRLVIRSGIPPLKTRADFRNWLLYRIQRIELHEAMEWFRDAETRRPLYDPHDEHNIGSRPDTGFDGINPYT